MILSRDFEYKTLNAVGLFRLWQSLCERVMVFTLFDAALKQIPLEQIYRAHVRVLDDSGILSYCDSLLKPTRCTMLCHCGIRRMCSHPLFSPILLLYKPFSCPSGHQLRNPEAIHKTVITRKSSALYLQYASPSRTSSKRARNQKLAGPPASWNDPNVDMVLSLLVA